MLKTIILQILDWRVSFISDILMIIRKRFDKQIAKKYNSICLYILYMRNLRRSTE